MLIHISILSHLHFRCGPQVGQNQSQSLGEIALSNIAGRAGSGAGCERLTTGMFAGQENMEE